jgi:hypothetical protein
MTTPGAHALALVGERWGPRIGVCGVVRPTDMTVPPHPRGHLAVETIPAQRPGRGADSAGGSAASAAAADDACTPRKGDTPAKGSSGDGGKSSHRSSSGPGGSGHGGSDGHHGKRAAKPVAMASFVTAPSGLPRALPPSHVVHWSVAAAPVVHMMPQCGQPVLAPSLRAASGANRFGTSAATIFGPDFDGVLVDWGAAVSGKAPDASGCAAGGDVAGTPAAHESDGWVVHSYALRAPCAEPALLAGIPISFGCRLLEVPRLADPLWADVATADFGDIRAVDADDAHPRLVRVHPGPS